MEVLTVYFAIDNTYSVLKSTDKKITKIEENRIWVKFRGVEYDGIIIGESSKSVSL